MIFSPEQAALKAQGQFDALRDFVQQAARDGQRIDTVERGLFRQLLGLGHTLLSAFVVQQGDGDLGPQVETAEGQIARRLPERHDRRYVSIFGELTITRAVYGSREGQKIGRVPLACHAGTHAARPVFTGFSYYLHHDTALLADGR